MLGRTWVWAWLVGAILTAGSAAADDGRAAGLARIYPPLPDGENGARLLMQACDAMVQQQRISDLFAVSSGVRNTVLPPEALTGSFRSAIAETIAANNESLGLLHEAKTYDACRYPIEFSAEGDVYLSHLSALRNLTRLSAWNAVDAAVTGDSVRAIRAIDDTAAIARSLTSAPGELAQTVRYFCGDVTIAAMVLTLRVGTFSDSDLAALQATAASLEDTKSFVSLLEGVRWKASLVPEPEPVPEKDEVDWEYLDTAVGNISGVASLGEVAPESAEDGGESLEGGSVTDVTSIGEIEPSAANANTSAEEIERQTLLAEAEAYLKQAHTPLEAIYQSVRLPDDFDPINPAASLEGRFGPLRRPVLAYVRFMARARVAQAALAAERFRLREGAAPKSLRDLVPDYLASNTLVDPCGGSLLDIDAREGWMVVYSAADELVNARARGEDSNAPSAISFAVTW
jgi:hypothetical protein